MNEDMLDSLEVASSIFKKIIDYKDSKDKLEKCKNTILEITFMLEEDEEEKKRKKILYTRLFYCLVVILILLYIYF